MKLFINATLVFLAVLLVGCGDLFVDNSIINRAKAEAAKPGLTWRQKGQIYEQAGDDSRANGQGGYAADMYFDAANSYDESTGRGDADVLRVYSKCSMASVSCRSIKDIIIDEWPSRRRAGVATHAPAPPVVPQAFGTINLPPPGARYPSTTTSPSSSTGSTGLYPPTGGNGNAGAGGSRPTCRPIDVVCEVDKPCLYRGLPICKY